MNPIEFVRKNDIKYKGGEEFSHSPEFFKKFDLIDTGRYWLNRDLKRCIVDDGKVVVIDKG